MDDLTNKGVQGELLHGAFSMPETVVLVTEYKPFFSTHIKIFIRLLIILI
jgi:hypothetical protein